MLRPVLLLAASTFAAAAPCTFCALNAQSQALNFDLSSLPATTYEANGYTVTSPCGQAKSAGCGAQNDPMLQSCKGVGDLSNISVVLTAGGFDVTLHNGFDDPPMPNGRNAVYHFLCDPSAPADSAPLYQNITEQPPGFYNVVWRHPAACGVAGGAACGPSPPVPPPVPPPTPCMAGSDTCVPTWTPTWHMRNSTVLYTCNNTGMHNVTAAVSDVQRRTRRLAGARRRRPNPSRRSPRPLATESVRGGGLRLVECKGDLGQRAPHVQRGAHHEAGGDGLRGRPGASRLRPARMGLP